MPKSVTPTYRSRDEMVREYQLQKLSYDAQTMAIIIDGVAKADVQAEPEIVSSIPSMAHMERMLAASEVRDKMMFTAARRVGLNKRAAVGAIIELTDAGKLDNAGDWWRKLQVKD